MVSLERNVCNPNLDMSISSITILPPAGSIILNKLNVKEDFPAPVRPTIPTYTFIENQRSTYLKTFLWSYFSWKVIDQLKITFSPPFTKNVIPFNTNSSSSR